MKVGASISEKFSRATVDDSKATVRRIKSSQNWAGEKLSSEPDHLSSGGHSLVPSAHIKTKLVWWPTPGISTWDTGGSLVSTAQPAYPNERGPMKTPGLKKLGGLQRNNGQGSFLASTYVYVSQHTHLKSLKDLQMYLGES